MPAEVVQPLLVALLLAVVVTAFHRRWPPVIAARHLAAVLALVLVAAMPTLVLVALTFVAHVPAVGRHAQWCAHGSGHHAQVPIWLGITGCAVLVIGAVRMSRVLVEHRRLRAATAVGPHAHDRIDIDDDPSAWAVTLPGPAGRIVLSSGLVAALDEAEAEVVIAHERAHARFRHDRYILFGELAAAMLPPLRWLASRLRFSVERWADEAAADECGDRRLVAHTIGKVALISSPVAYAVGFIGLGVVDRVQMMLSPPVVRLRNECRLVIGGGSVLVGASAVYQWHHLGELLTFFCHA